MKTSVWTWILLVVLCTSSCMMVDEQGDATPLLVAWCDDSSECAGDLICDDVAHVCVLDEPLDIQAWVRLLPPDNSLLALEEQYGNMQVSNSKPLNLALNRPIKVNASVTVGEKKIPVSEIEDITAVSEGEISDLKIHEYAQASDSNLDDTGASKPGLTLWVNQGKTYDITVNLTSSDEEGEIIPPVYHLRRSYKPDFAFVDPYFIQSGIKLPSKELYIPIAGYVMKSGDEPVPLVGARVHAQCDETGNISSVATTDSDGYFSILVQPLDELAVETYKLLLKPSAQNELVPRLLLGEVDVTESDPPEVTLDAGTFMLDNLQEMVDLEVRVLTPEEQFDLAFLAETVVRFTGKVGTGALEVERTVDKDGKVYATLPRMNYVVSVMPPTRTIQGDEQKFGINQQLLQLAVLASDSLEMKVVLAQRPEVHGFVLDPLGHTVPDAAIEATFTGKGTYPDLSTLPTRFYETYTDDTGRYKIRLDPGQYRIVVDPPVESGFPRRIERNVFVQNSQQRTFDLSYPNAVTGTIVGMHKAEEPGQGGGVNGVDPLQTADSAQPYKGPAVNVKIELYDEAEANSQADGLKPVPVATAVTDQDGNFTLVVPAQ